MAFSKLFSLLVCASTLATASVLQHRSSSFPVKRSEGIVPGEKSGVSYYWNSTGTSAQCPTLNVPNLQSGLTYMDPFFFSNYNGGPYGGPTPNSYGTGGFYLSFGMDVWSFAVHYTIVTPNTTATWVNNGADFANVWYAVREDTVHQWSQNTTFQNKWYDVNKIVDGVSKHAGQFEIHIQTPSFVRGCDTSCGGTCTPYKCDCGD